MVALCVVAASGCSTPYMLFHALGSRHYTDGTTEADRESRYNQQVERWKGCQLQSSDPGNQ
jgi:hypothetical protein